jgi:hypothetical protein
MSVRGESNSKMGCGIRLGGKIKRHWEGREGEARGKADNGGS